MFKLKKITFFTLLLFVAVQPNHLYSQPIDKTDPSKLVDVGSRKQLFIDDALIASSRKIKLTMNPPVKTGEQMIVADKPWESGGLGAYCTVLKVDDEYRLYYNCVSYGSDKSKWIQPPEGSPFPPIWLCMATSHDGKVWRKPNLGIVEFDGSMENNIVFPPKASWNEGGHVFLDSKPGIPADEKFKLTCRWDGPDGSNWNHEYTLKSPDGLHWTPLSDKPAFKASDTGNVGFWDDRIGRYVVYVRLNEPEKDRPDARTDGSSPAHRHVARCETDDLSHWGERKAVLSFDEIDPPGLDLYNNAIVKYPWSNNVYLIFPSAYWHFPEPPAGPYPNDGILDIRLATSRDGVHFQYPSRSPFVPLGLEGSFDSGAMYMIAGMIRQGGELWMYYSSFNSEERHAPVLRTNSVISRLILRLDGFVSADTPYEGGELTTVPLVFTGKSLELNVQTSVAGHVLVELLHNGESIQGYSASDADLVKGNFIAKTVTWNGQSDISSLVGKSVQVRFVMRDSKLYAFQFMANSDNSDQFPALDSVKIEFSK